VLSMPWLLRAVMPVLEDTGAERLKSIAAANVPPR
jgi:hypothetical protein